MLEAFVSVTRAVANQVQATIAEKAPDLAQCLDLPQRQRFVELVARGFDTFVHGLERATREAQQQQQQPQLQPQQPPPREASGAGSAAPTGRITLGPQPVAQAAAPAQSADAGASASSSGGGGGTASEGVDAEDDEVFARKFAQLFLDMGGIFPKLAQVLSLRPDLIKNRTVLLRLRAVQEECKRMPFEEAVALVKAESPPFGQGRYQLKNWPRHVHAGSIAQVAPFVDCSGGASGSDAPPPDAAGTEAEEGRPDGIVKMTFERMRQTMEVDFRLLRSQLHWMEQTGQWTRTAPGLAALRPKNINKLREVWKAMVGMEAEVLQEFDLRHEADCQMRGAALVEGLLGHDGSFEWLEEWRNQAFSAVLRPAGPQVASQAQETWRTGTLGAGRPAGGWLTRLARRAYLGRAAADELAEGERHVARLRAALRSLQVRVPAVLEEASGPHVLSMAVAEGRSLKEVLDVVSEESRGSAQKAAAWFAALLLFVIVPLWGKMLLAVGCCHADPHPGNFKVSGVPGLEEAMAERATCEWPRQRGILSRIMCNSTPTQPEDMAPALNLWVLDWGSCVDLEEDVRQSLCRLVIGLSNLRAAQRHLKASPEDAEVIRAEAEATLAVATCVRLLGLQSEDDSFLAALAMVLFDPSVAASHPSLKGGRAEEELGRGFPATSGMGKVLRIIAILVGICRELEARMNEEAAGRLSSACQAEQPFLELFLVELWRPFAEEGLA
uniref:ABC1 atypical kinase-like domain-containing protein n=1 Tax=Alexandrium monilatum TaxID=311494 RepID=A0A7S4SF55_9DINO